MYHPAKVQEIIATSDGNKFFVETWDENAFTLDVGDGVDPDSIEQGAVVLLDYYPDPDYDLPTPKQVVAAVLDDEQGDRIWTRYKDLYEDAPNQQTAMQMQQMPFDGNYIG